MKKILCVLLVTAFCMNMFGWALASSDDDELEFTLFPVSETADEDDTAPAEEETDESTEEDAEPETSEETDPSLPVYENDGSILLTLSFTGDFTIGDNVQSSGKSIFEKELAKQAGNQSFMFRNIREVLKSDDLTVINFEGTLTTEGRNPEKKENEFLFRAAPEYAKILKLNGVEAVSLENNHVLDMGQQGLADTKQNLTDAGISYASEDEPAILTIKGIQIGMLAYQTFGGRHDEIASKLPDAISALREQGCDIVIVCYHWGAEKDYEPNENQIKLGRATIDAGADLVIGHHSHRINPIEYYNGHYICYSLGNFCFAGNNKPSDMYSYIFQIRIRFRNGQEPNYEAIRIIPGRISSRTDYNDFAFTPLTQTEKIQSVLKLLKNYSKNLDYALDTYPLKWPDE